MYDFSHNKNLLYALGIGITVAVCYVVHEKYLKEEDGLKKDK